jgi:hypothetical protein
MSLLWFIAAVSLLAALIAWRKARATEKRVEQLSHMYWELKYQHGELRGQVQRLAPPDQSRRDSAEPDAAPARPTDGFIPLSSLKR